MKLPRPYIPLSVRVAVAERQLGPTWVAAQRFVGNLQDRLGYLLTWLRFDLGAVHIQLDHDPALGLRPYTQFKGKRIYQPDANDPAYLKYRPVEAHRTKTFLRGEHGQRSDISQIKRERRRKRPKRAKRKIPQRKNPWPKARNSNPT